MASRQEEKEARRLERQAQEEAERRAAARNRRLQMVLGGVLALLVIGGAIFAITAGGGDDGGDGNSPTTAADKDLPKLPAAEETDLDAAVKAAGCKLVHAKNEGGGHEEKTFTAADYGTNPPSSGAHHPVPATEGIYDSGPPDLGPSVHALEHGRINFQYRKGAPKQEIDQMKALFAENGGYHSLLFENQTSMDAEVAATAWTQVLTCPEVTDKTWDAMRTFRDRYIDQGPESVP